MDDFDLYGDLELLHQEEKQNAIEDLKWKDKYKAALITIEKLQADNKELKKKIKNLETNFAGLFDTARTEIKRKDNLITELRKQKDDICFRRTKPQFNEEANHRRGTSNESVPLNPFASQPRKPTSSNSEKSEQFSDEINSVTLDNGKRKFESGSYRDRNKGSRNVSHERDQVRDRPRDRSKDRSRHRNRSRDRTDERSRNRFDDRIDKKYRDKSEDRCRNRSKERFSRRDEKDEKKKKETKMEASVTKSSDGSWNGNDKQSNYTKENKNETCSKRTEKEHENHQTDLKSNNDDPKHKINSSKVELNKHNNTNYLQSEKRISPKIEILQIEVLNDLKEFKKNKLKLENTPKPEPIDPAKVAIEKSNQFLEALFDDSILNKAEDSTNDLYDDIIFPVEKIDASRNDGDKKENLMNKNENFNFHTPQRQSNTAKHFDDLCGSSPAEGSITMDRKKDILKYGTKTTVDSDFVLIIKPEENKKETKQILQMPSVEGMIIDDCDNHTDKNSEIKATESSTSNVDSEKKHVPTSEKPNEVVKKKHEKIDENFNFKQQMPPQKQTTSTNLMIDLFGPSPVRSICGQKSSVTSMDESSGDFYFEPNIKPISTQNKNDIPEQISSNLPVNVDDNCMDNVKVHNEINEINQQQSISLEKELNENNSAVVKPFTFAELDSSFYSSEEENNENLNTSKSRPSLRKTEVSEKDLNNAINEVNPNKTFQVNSSMQNKSNETSEEVILPQTEQKETSGEKLKCTFKNKAEKKEFTKTNEYSRLENQKESRRHHNLPEKLNQKDDLLKRSKSSKHKSNSCDHRKSSSDENEHRFSKEKPRNHYSHHHHEDKDRSKQSKHAKHDSLERTSQKNVKISKEKKEVQFEAGRRYPKEQSNSIGSKNEISESRCSPLLVYYDEDSVKDNLQNPKISDQDQVFFLHCDDISSEDEIISKETVSNKFKNESIEENNEKCVEPEIIHENKSAIKSADTQLNNESENSGLMNGVELNKKDAHSNDKPIILSNKDNIVDLDGITNESQDKHLALREITSSTNDENLKKETLSDVKTEINMTTNQDVYPSSNSEEICQLNTCPTEEHALKSFEESQKNDDDVPKQTVNKDTKEYNQKSEFSNNDVAASNCSRNFFEEVVPQEIELSSEERHQTNESMAEGNKPTHSIHSINECVELYETSNVNQSIVEDIANNTEDIPKEISTDVIPANKENQCDGSKNSCLKTSPQKREITSTTIETQASPSEKIVDQNLPHLLNLHPTQISPQKSNNSADEIESSHSNTDLVSCGRRKKIKTPRKRTNISAIKDISNGPMSIVLDRNSKCNEVHPSSESALPLSEEPFKLIPPNENKDKEMFLTLSRVSEKKETDNVLIENTTFSTENRSELPLTETNNQNYESNSSSASFSETNQADKPPTVDQVSTSVSSQSAISKASMEKESKNKMSESPEQLQGHLFKASKAEGDQSKELCSPCGFELMKSDKGKNEDVVETFSVMVKINKNKNKNNNETVENIQTIRQERHSEIRTNTVHKSKNIDDDKSINLSTEIQITTSKEIQNPSHNLTKEDTNKHCSLLASANTLVEASTHSSTNYSDESIGKKPKEKKVRKKKSASISREDNNEAPKISNSETKSVQLKKRSKSKRLQILDSSKSSEEDGEASCILKNKITELLTNGANNMKRTSETKEEDLNMNKTKKKRKRNLRVISSDSESQIEVLRDDHIELSKSNLAIDLKISTSDPIKSKKKNANKVSPSRTDDFRDSHEVIKKCSSPNQLEIVNSSSETVEKLSFSNRLSKNIHESCQTSIKPTGIHSNNFHTEKSEDLCDNTKLNNSGESPSTQSLSGEDKKDQDSYKHKKPKRPRKRKLSKSSDSKSGEVQLKKSKHSIENSSQTCDITSSPATEKNLNESTKQPQPSPHSESSMSVALTPTHHKIFLNDIFPNDPPPVYNGHDDDVQYQEIDKRLRSMFQSPSYTQTTAEESSFEKKTDDIQTSNVNVSVEETFNQTENVEINEQANQTTNMEIDETLNKSDKSHCDTSISSRKVSLGSNEYVIESTGSHTANVFIKRKRSKKRSKVCTTPL